MWRSRLERNLTGPNKGKPNPTKAKDLPDTRYTAIPDILCENNRFGQKTGGGWYDYLPTAPRTPVNSKITQDIIETYRIKNVYYYCYYYIV